MKTTNPYSMLDAGHDAWREGYADCQRDMQRAGGDVEKREKLYRVVEVHPEDRSPLLNVGDIVNGGERHAAIGGLSDGYVDYLLVTRAGAALGTWCKLEEVKDEPMEEKSGPVCSVCNDTHRMEGPRKLGQVPCTHCPVPCGKCAADNGRLAYCATTPCPCECHVAKCEVVSSGMRGGKTPEEKSEPITFTDAEGFTATLKVDRDHLDRFRYATPDDLTRAGYVSRLQNVAEKIAVREEGERALSRVATAIGLPETAGEEEILARCDQYHVVASDPELMAKKAIGESWAEAVEQRQGSPLPVKALESMASLNVDGWAYIYDDAVRPHLALTVAELKAEVLAAYGGPVPKWIEGKLDAIVAAAQREKARRCGRSA